MYTYVAASDQDEIAGLARCSVYEVDCSEPARASGMTMNKESYWSVD